MVKEKKVKKKCCAKFVKKGKHCGKCPIADDCDMKDSVMAQQKDKKTKKAGKKKKKDKK